MKPPPANSFKIVVVGSSGVGKSAIVQRLVDGTFRDEGQSTVGVEFKPFIIPVENQTVKLQIWDTAGQERFKSVSKAYFRNAVGAVLVFDVTSEASFEDLANWLHDLQQLCNANAYIMCVGNKRDLADQRQVGTQQAKDFADRHRLEYLETSALSGENVTEAFTRLAFGIAARVSSGAILAGVPSSKVNPFKDPPAPAGGQGGPCC
jgi:small GTP-binding protein